MKTVLLLFMFFSAVSLKAEEKQKNYHKIFPVEGIEEVVIENCFGKVEVCQQEEARTVEVAVQISVEAKSAGKAEETLEMIRVADSHQDESLKLETLIEKGIAFRHFMTNMEVDVDYRIVIPRGLKLRMIVSNGDVDLGDFEGEITADIRTGDFRAGKIKAAGLDLKQEKGEFEAEEVDRLSAEFQDCEIEIGTLGEMDGTFSACSCVFGSVGKMDVRSSGGKVRIGDIERLICGSQYTDYVVEDVGHLLDMDMKWGSLNVGNVQELFSEIRVKGIYTRLGFTFARDAAYSMSVRHSRSSRLELPRGMKVEMKQGDRKNMKEFSVVKGKGKEAGQVRLELSGGSLYIQ